LGDHGHDTNAVGFLDGTATANEAVYLVGALFFTEEEMIDELNRRRSSR
jgi:hypothetical protein